MRIAALAVRMLLGALFIFSAVTKLLDIDRFEIYIYSYNLLSLNLSFLAARLTIVAELLLGIGLLSNAFKRFTDTCALLLLVAFTLFLGYAILIGRTDNCHCMGSLVDLNPAKSILKNALLLVLLVFAMGAPAWRWRPRWYVWLPVVVAPLVAVFCLSAPDNWLFGPSNELYNQEELDRATSPQGELRPLGLTEGRHVVAFLTPSCQYCQMAAQKLTHICRRNGLDSAAFVFLTPQRDSSAAPLTLDTLSFERPAYGVSQEPFMRITYGQRPIIFLVREGKVEGTCHYRNIDEKQIVDFLTIPTR